MDIVLIAALAENGVIGKDGGFPWPHLPGDLRRFQKITNGHPIVMGRKTYESLPNGALSDRLNVVLTRNAEFRAEGIFPYSSLDTALADLRQERPEQDNIDYSRAFIIGGAGVYREALPLADILELTHVKGEFEGDTYFPEVNLSRWNKEIKGDHRRVTFATYTK